MTLKYAIATFETFEQEDLYDIIQGISEDQPDLFMAITDAIERELSRTTLQEMREETFNGYYIYPELQN